MSKKNCLKPRRQSRPGRKNRRNNGGLFAFDRRKKRDGFFLAGLDEAGRGPLAGPVVAACVSLKKNSGIPILDDSKKLTARQREKLYPEIIRKSLAYGLGIVDNRTIDRINILEASRLAMRKAFRKMQRRMKPSAIFALIDGNMTVSLPGKNNMQCPVVKGDSRSACIAGASVLAKVTRDRIMQKLHRRFPLYGFDRHKGYPTAGHIEAIRKHGILDIHRRTFFPVSEMV